MKVEKEQFFFLIKRTLKKFKKEKENEPKDKDIQPKKSIHLTLVIYLVSAGADRDLAYSPSL